VRHYLRDLTFSRFDTILECDRQTDRHTTMAYTALSIALRGKNGVDEASFEHSSKFSSTRWQR